MRKPRAIILDFDGVIVETERGKFAWLKHALKQHGLVLRQDDFTRMTGKKTGAFLQERFGDKLSPQAIDAITHAWRSERLRNVRRYSRPVRGVIQFIKALKREGFKLCLATGTEKPIVQKVLSILGIPRVFDVMITGNECALSKPNPQVYLLAIKAVGVPAREILVIEDSAAGVLAAKQAGLRCVAITTTHAARQLKQADVVVRSFKELHRLLQKASR